MDKWIKEPLERLSGNALTKRERVSRVDAGVPFLPESCPGPSSSFVRTHSGLGFEKEDAGRGACAYDGSVPRDHRYHTIDTTES